MSQQYFKYAVFTLFLCLFGVHCEVNVTLNRNYVGVWFDYAVRHYEYEADNAYSKTDLGVMTQVISTRFNKIIIESAPPLEKLPPSTTANSRIWIPSVVAEQNNRNVKNSSYHPMKVVVSFDVGKIARTEQASSFDVAKYMADTANTIHAGTVDTLMMYTGFTVFSAYYNARDMVQQLKIAREKLNASAPERQYKLGVVLDLKDCGKFRGEHLGEKTKEILPHVDIIVTLLRPSYHQLSWKPNVVHNMLITKLEDCERKLKQEKPNISLIPSVLFLSRKDSVVHMFRCWQMMSDWATKNEREVYMHEAFDTPHGHLLSDHGWWRLINQAEHQISPSVFVEKVQVDISSKNMSETGSSAEYSSDEDSDMKPDRRSRQQSDDRRDDSSSSKEQSNANAVYIVLILLSVICTLLVATIVGLVYGFHAVVLKKNGNFVIHHHNQNGSTRHHSLLEDDSDLNGSILEIRDTTPIVAVTYKK